MEFRLLGPFEVEADQPVVIRRRRERFLLAVLLLEQGSSVDAQRLVELLWDGDPAPKARTVLSGHVSRLRAALGPARVSIIRQGPGYLLRTDPDRIDAHRFRGLVRQAHEQAEPERRARVLRRALGLWRGPVLADLLTDPVRNRLGAALEDLRLEALDECVAAELSAGRHDGLIAELRELVTAHPTVERFAAHLMLALYRSGRQADALDAYERSRRHLADELGLSPGLDLRALHEPILRADPTLDLAQPDRARAAAPARPPRQLPHDVANFTGRAAELAELDAVALDGDGGGPAPVIVSISGAPGTGKTTLAVHWAHRMAVRYPDGQLYVNLRGHGPGEPVTPAVAAEVLLRGLGVDSESIPPGVEERSALLRSALSGRRVLMLLDNARDSEQVRPLVPGSGSLVIVASRDQLRGLRVRAGAHRVTLDRLPHDEAVALLATSIGPAAINAEPAAAEHLVKLCDRLPLALAIVAERAHRAATLAEVVGQLEDERARLDGLGVDSDADLRVALSWSYRALGDTAAGLFRKLGLYPATDLSLPAAAALAGLAPAVAAAAMDQLVEAHLVWRCRTDRYQMHDLIRLYANELAGSEESSADLDAADRRLLDWYLHAAVSADTMLLPARRREFVKPFRPSTPPPVFADPGEAMTWFEREYASLRSIFDCAVERGFAGHAWRIALNMTSFSHNAIPWHDVLDFYAAVLRAAEAAGELVGQGHALNALGRLSLDKGDLLQARLYLRRAFVRFHRLSDDHGAVLALGNLGLLHGYLGQALLALRYSTAALELSERLEDPRGIAMNLDNVGVAFTVAGEYDRAIEYHRRAEKVIDELGDLSMAASCQHLIGRVHSFSGDFVRSARAYHRAVLLYRRLGNRRWEAVALKDFGWMLNKLGHPGLARSMWETALVTLTEVADPRAATVRHYLETLPGASLAS